MIKMFPGPLMVVSWGLVDAYQAKVMMVREGHGFPEEGKHERVGRGGGEG